MTWREFKLVKSGRTQVWRIRNLGLSYETEHGIENMKFQRFADSPGDKGKPETKAYVSAEDNTAWHISREIRKKEEHGYIEYINGKPNKEIISSLDFAKFLPKNFCSYKPQSSIDSKVLLELEKKDKLLFSRKIDGMCHLAVHHTWGWEIYSRRMDLSSERFPKHLEALSQTTFPVGTILVGELVCFPELGKREDFKAISRICRSLPEEARKIIAAGEVPEPHFIIFDMLFQNSLSLKDKSYQERSLLWQHLPVITELKVQDLIGKIDYIETSSGEWEKLAKSNGWEGFVVVDKTAVPGNKMYSFDGTPARPKGHHKLKPVSTEDVVVYAAVGGSGKRLNGVGAVFIKQIHPDTSQFFNCGKCGSGFTEDDLVLIENLCHEYQVPILAKDTDIKNVELQAASKLVIEIEYSERIEDTGKFRFPVFIRVRDDKTDQECIANL